MQGVSTAEAEFFSEGQRLRAAGKFPEAIAQLEAAAGLNPHRAETLLSLGVIKLQQGEAAEAIALTQRALAVRADYGEAWDAQGLAQVALGDHAASLEAFSKACALEPWRVAFTLHKVEAAIACGAETQLRAELAAGQEMDPLAVAPLAGLGLLALRNGQAEEAIDFLEAAQALDETVREVPMLLGIAYTWALRPGRAAIFLRQALALEPEHQAIANDLAVTLGRLQRHEEGAALLEATIEKSGPSMISLSNLATAKAALGEMDAAVAAARQAMEMAPDANGPARAYCNLLPYQDGVSAMELLAVLRRSGATLPARPALSLRNTKDAARVLRIGLLSNLLRTHPVGWLTVAGLEALDKAAFSIHCFGRFEPGDALAQRFARFAASWERAEAMDDANLARCIRDAEIDILIDLGGFGDTGRIHVCGWRPAPLQVKWVGMQFHSTGMDFMDYFVSDPYETPEGFDAFYSEKLLRLPDDYVCYAPPAYAPEIGELPALRNGFVTFGCLNNLMKFTPATLQCWAEIMLGLPGSRVVLRCAQFSDPGPRERVTGQFGKLGIAESRLSLMGRAPHRAFLDTYNEIDLALDPFPYTGGLSTCEALYMGVPVLTRAGEIFAARHSLSHLMNARLPEWIAADTANYQAKAWEFAKDLEMLAQLRGRLRRQIQESPLCDARRFGANLGQGLRKIWADYCAGA